MALDRFDRTLVSHDVIQDLKYDAELRRAFAEDRGAFLDRYPLQDAERRALLEEDYLALYHLGFHPYLLTQLARLYHGANEGTGASDAAQALIRSLQELR